MSDISSESVRRHRTEPPPDQASLTYLLQDIARLPAVTSRSEWLPLLRHIRRGTLLDSLSGPNARSDDSKGYATLVQSLHNELATYNAYCRFHGHRLLVPELIARDRDQFFTEPDFLPSFPIPATAPAHASETDLELLEAEVRRGWEIYYLLSLLPKSSLTDYRKPLADQDEVEDHFATVRSCHQRSQDNLARGTLRYVLTIARLYIGQGLPYLDLVQEGVLGLMRATESFREEQSSHFQHYASAWIRQAITRAIADQARIIRIPVHLHEAVAKLKETYDELYARLGRPPSLIEFGLAGEWLTADDVALIHRDNQREILKRKMRLWEERFFQVKSAIRRSTNSLVITDTETSDDDSDVLDFTEPEPDAIPLFDPTGNWGPRMRRAAEDIWRRHVARNDKNPTFIEFCLALDWLTPHDVRLLDSATSPTENDARTRANQNLAHTRKALMRILATYPYHHPTEQMQAELNPCDEPELLSLPDPHALDALRVIHWDMMGDLILEVLDGLSERERKVIAMRFGLLNHDPMTLEEIGQHFGLTRERIRQIEAKAIRRLQHPTRKRKLVESIFDSVTIPQVALDRHHHKLRRIVEDFAQREYDAPPLHAQRERQNVERLIDYHLPHQRRRVFNTMKRRGRAELFRQILLGVNQPLHFADIHQRALAQIPANFVFAERTAYATLFNHPYFTNRGQGYFGLLEWQNGDHTAGGEFVFSRCPSPLLNAARDPRSFFETIVMGHSWLQTNLRPTARQFYLDMLAWADRPHENMAEAQSAFDAWYAAGLLDKIDYATAVQIPLESRLPSGLRLPDMRSHCLDTICRRIPKMIEMLAVMDQLNQPTTTTIKQILFGANQPDLDVQMRLSLLAAFDAVRLEGSHWRVGAPGKALLAANPLPDLPDLGDLADELEEDDGAPVEIEWDESLGLMLV